MLTVNIIWIFPECFLKGTTTSSFSLKWKISINIHFLSTYCSFITLSTILANWMQMCQPRKFSESLITSKLNLAGNGSTIFTCYMFKILLKTSVWNHLYFSQGEQKNFATYRQPWVWTQTPSSRTSCTPGWGGWQSRHNPPDSSAGREHSFTPHSTD